MLTLHQKNRSAGRAFKLYRIWQTKSALPVLAIVSDYRAYNRLISIYPSCTRLLLNVPFHRPPAGPTIRCHVSSSSEGLGATSNAEAFYAEQQGSGIVIFLRCPGGLLTADPRSLGGFQSIHQVCPLGHRCTWLLIVSHSWKIYS